MRQRVAIFGESEKGRFHFLYYFLNLPSLMDTLGNPPDESQGLHLAIQTLLFDHDLIYIRVKEEGFSKKEYQVGLELLNNSGKLDDLTAVCLPGVGSKELVSLSTRLCVEKRALLLTTQKDLFDYLTDR